MKKKKRPNSRSGSENKNGLIILGRRDLSNLKSFAHSGSQFNHIPSTKPTQRLRRRSLYALHQELEHALGGGERRRGGDGEEGRLVGVGEAKLEVLAWFGVGGGEVGEVGDVDGDVEEGFGGGKDGGERGGGPESGVLADGGGDGGEAAGEVGRGFKAEAEEGSGHGGFGVGRYRGREVWNSGGESY